MRAAVKDQAELIAISYADATDLTYGSDQEMEKAYVQYVSGWMFGAFGLRPALGRLFTENDDRKPGAHPYAVLSYDYWTRRFGQDPKVIGPHVSHGQRPVRDRRRRSGALHRHRDRHGDRHLPAHHDASRRRRMTDWTWLRTLAQLKPGVAVEPVRQKLQRDLAGLRRGAGQGLHRT